jgi:hypothetical protein
MYPKEKRSTGAGKPTHPKLFTQVLKPRIRLAEGWVCFGKQPADYHIWILAGTARASIREEGQLYEGGPIWRIEQISPLPPLAS